MGDLGWLECRYSSCELEPLGAVGALALIGGLAAQNVLVMSEDYWLDIGRHDDYEQA